MKFKFNSLLLVLLQLLQVVYSLTQKEVLLSLRDEDGIIKITDENYGLFRTGVADFYNVLYVTMSQSNTAGQVCEMCFDFEKTLRKVTSSILKQEPDANVLFFIADVSDMSLIVDDLKLTNVPHLVVYPPPTPDQEFSWSTSPFYQYELNVDNANDVMQFGDYLAKILRIYLRIQANFDYNEFVTYFVGFMAVFIIFKKLILPLITNKWKSFCILVAFIILLPSITGYKFTEMNAIALIARDKDDKIMFFSGGMGWQFGIEVFTVSLMYIVMAGLVIALILSPRLKVLNTNTGAFLSVVLGSCLLYMFSYYLSCFKIKNPYYPYTY
ncbi:hypothetical protein NCAS_0H02690 [Naumovozyma castellii]|uniref:Dolichyl-diphosphooligosaccharide--protein glycosyltransferase subunit OST6 n=1 Tax=Naumovozyma castellii TaxID=27288 RepID=G0VJA0_NAUCA|nr:hypothetical protein NCAS_0H02690 [Naumovozyma castellii CBS 4309]CCC71579.1 hypothetical protein NCAS_0H02690 [Naumovozyma castellii CBS 4309]